MLKKSKRGNYSQAIVVEDNDVLEEYLKILQENGCTPIEDDYLKRIEVRTDRKFCSGVLSPADLYSKLYSEKKRTLEECIRKDKNTGLVFIQMSNMLDGWTRKPYHAMIGNQECLAKAFGLNKRTFVKAMNLLIDNNLVYTIHSSCTHYLLNPDAIFEGSEGAKYRVKESLRDNTVKYLSVLSLMSEKEVDRFKEEYGYKKD